MLKVNPFMVTLAREAQGMSQSALAKAVGIGQPALSRIENGKADATPELVRQLAEILGFRAEFFYQSAPVRSLPISFYRKRVRASATTVRAIQARVNIIRLQIATLLKSVDIPELNLPFVDEAEIDDDIERVASELRIQWRLPSGPIDNLTRAMEDAGILIVPCSFETRQVDALSIYVPQDGVPPIVFVNHLSPGDRLRFSLAHELGHIVFHSHGVHPEDDIEDVANRFAQEFLMPEVDIRPFLKFRGLEDVASLKPAWKVSMQALIMRAAYLDKITDGKKRYLFSLMSSRGYRKSEPYPIEAETPALVSELVECHTRDLEYTTEELADLLCTFEADVRETFRLIPPKLRLVRGTG